MPIFTGSEGEQPVGFFATTVRRMPGVAAIELRHQGAVLATFAAGTQAPSVALKSPAGGELFASGALTVTWSAGDPDGDAVDVSILYSADDGATWKPVASAQGGGTAALPVGALGGSSAARIKIVAGDGFTSTTVTSEVFAVAAQPPQPYISLPRESGDQALEGRETLLIGGALDGQDGALDGAALRWFSSRDGALGSGREAHARLSAGAHLIVLEARNSAGLSALAYSTLTVLPDYDADGIPDAQEKSYGTNLLNPIDARSDDDGDGLPLITEWERGTNPGVADTDGDGVVDGDELAAGSDPLAADAAPQDALVVSPPALTFTVDLALGGALPQRFIQIMSGKATTWTLSADAPWAGASVISGATPGQATIVVDPSRIANGTQRGVLTVTAEGLGSATIPMVAIVSGKAGYCDANRDGVLNAADVAMVDSLAGAALGQPGYDFHADLNRDGVIDTADRTLATACLIEVAPVGRVFLPNVAKPSMPSRAP
jgi:hypothetical protein